MSQLPPLFVLIFYHIRKNVDGMEFVTARGWEDLSAILQEYEELTLLNPGSAARSAARVETDGDGSFTAELFALTE